MATTRATLHRLVNTDQQIGLTAERTLQPLGGRGDWISPPTYAQPEGEPKGPRYVYAKRRTPDGRMVDTVMLDSPASQANRMEEGLLELTQTGRINLPMHVVHVPSLGKLTDLELPHRVYDATIQTAYLRGGDKPYRDSKICNELREASRKNAAPLLEHAPVVLVLGGWDSHTTLQRNAWQGKYEKTAWSKIVGIDTSTMERPGGRLDPAGLPTSDRIDLGDGAKPLAKQGLGTVPASVGPGNRVSVSVDHAEQRSVLSLAALRRLEFGSTEQNEAAWTYLAALALLALSTIHESGMHLRSECTLVQEAGEEPGTWCARPSGERLTGATTEECIRVLKESEQAVRASGLQIRTEPIELDVHPKLDELRRKGTTKKARKSAAKNTDATETETT
ncbi:MAG: type I-U CRISPR-associated RAMP protein Csb1/Cas7u [Acidobacteria bacterium]|nr:type I-U CRISPR-associated RAMP protein Csb1/Cas7u [Acidobacteriota bacterium]